MGVLWTIFVILLVLWLIGFIGFRARVGGIVHVLLIIAAVVLLINLLAY